MNIKNKKSGFTLIELLVVISIISLLSSVVLSTVNSARERASIAAGLKFDGYNYRVLGTEAAVIYTFDESSGGPIDYSGNSNTASIIGTVNRVSDTPNNVGNSLSFSGNGGNYVRVLSNPSLEFTGDLTISAWIKPSAINGYRGIVSKRNGPADFQLHLDDLCGGCVTHYHNNWGGGPPVVRSGYVPKLNVWTHVSASLKGTEVTIYINGSEVHKGTANSVRPINPNAHLNIGSRDGGNEPFQGLIDEVRIYKRSLTALEVESIYAEGLKNIELAGNP